MDIGSALYLSRVPNIVLNNLKPISITYMGYGDLNFLKGVGILGV